MDAVSVSFYLAIKEVWRQRGRYLLLSLVIALITLLVLFLAALGDGLADANREYLANLDAQLVVFREKSDYIIASSQLGSSTLRAVRRVSGVASAGPIYVSSAEVVSTDKPSRVSLLAAEPGFPGMPALIAGRSFREGDSREIVIDRDFALRSGTSVGDRVRLRATQGSEDQFFDLVIVGVTEGQSYLFQPAIFVAPATWERIRPQSESDLRDDSLYANIIVVRLENPADLPGMQARMMEAISGIEVADIPTTISNVPGYSAQQATIRTQGLFTLLIAILVIGGFFQIQLLQKVPQIGMLKAIGSSNASVGTAAVLQILVVTAIGVALGTCLTFLIALGFPPTVPLSFNGMSVAFSLVALMLIGPVGGLVSVIYAVRIEPLRALRLQ